MKEEPDQKPIIKWEYTNSGARAKFPRGGGVEFVADNGKRGDGARMRYGGKEGYVVRFGRQFAKKPVSKEVLIAVLEGWMDELEDMIEFIESEPTP